MPMPPPKPYTGMWLKDRLQLLAFDARLAGVPPIGLVRKHLEGCGRRVRARRRALAEGDFRFRGGLRHPPGAHTRLTDPEPVATARLS